MRAPDLAQQRGAVDLVLQVVRLELLDRAGDRPERGDVLAHRGSASNRPSRPSCDTSPAALAAAGSKWYLRSR